MPDARRKVTDNRQEYISRFDLREDGENWEVELAMSGPADSAWLEVDRTGRVFGTPRNVHVGNWTVNLTLDDSNGGLDHAEWTISVVNELPVIIPPAIGKWPEYSPLELDFDSGSEMDGLTSYSLVSGPDGAVINSGTGVVSYLPVNLWGNVTFEVRVDDGNGGRSTISHTVSILDQPAKLLTVW